MDMITEGVSRVVNTIGWMLASLSIFGIISMWAGWINPMYPVQVTVHDYAGKDLDTVNVELKEDTKKSVITNSEGKNGTKIIK